MSLASHVGAQSNKAEMNTVAQTNKFRETLIAEAATYDVVLPASALDGLAKYYELLNVWNSRVHLVAPCSAEEFATRHVLESLVLLKHLPADAYVAEVGAGGGLPIIPCLIVRPDVRAVLIEAAQKKAVFLREALNQAGTSARANVINERFENVATPPVDFITCRALERFEEMLTHLLEWAPANATLLLFGAKRLGTKIESLGFKSSEELMPNSSGRFLYVVHKTQASATQSRSGSDQGHG
ncbi:MAG TPA: RsmG family class I SAM-dependent methyltransferase [Pyrinomonadaceae bacterium]|jgi:16S rRNA (guanine(527)-N(7))-methyltransferase RsmG|nr:RsmG family class I SAM-dependent methyltransferase [Pyrinomonadaceae bacterium]